MVKHFESTNSPPEDNNTLMNSKGKITNPNLIPKQPTYTTKTSPKK